MIEEGKPDGIVENQVHHYTQKSGSQKEPIQSLSVKKKKKKEVKPRVTKISQKINNWTF